MLVQPGWRESLAALLPYPLCKRVYITEEENSITAHPFKSLIESENAHMTHTDTVMVSLE